MSEQEPHFFKLIDLFGVMFNFRMKNYKKFRSKTGAIVTIICLISCNLASLLDILTFLDPTKNFTEKIFYKRFPNETINFIDQNFTFALNLPDIVPDKDFWIVEMKYKHSLDFKKNENRRHYDREEYISEIPCDYKKLDTERDKKIAKNLNLRCYGFNRSQEIMGDYYAKKFSYVEIKLLTKKKYYLEKSYYKNDKVYVDVFYPKNYLKEYSQYDQLEKTMTNVHTPLYSNRKLRQNLFLKQFHYSDDNGLIFKNIKDYIYTNLDVVEKEFYHLNSRENKGENVELGKIFFREGSTPKRYVKTVIKLMNLLKSIMSSLVNILLVTGFFMELINLIKAKKSVIENCVFIDKGWNIDEEEDYIKMKMNPNNFEANSAGRNSNHNRESRFNAKNFSKKSLSPDIKKISIMENNNNKNTSDDLELNDIFDNSNSINNNEANSNNISKQKKISNIIDYNDIIKEVEEKEGNNENDNEMEISKEINNSVILDSFTAKNLDEKMIKENTENLQENLNENENEFQRRKTTIDKISSKMNFRTLIWAIICCKRKKTDDISKMFKFTSNKFNNYLYIVEYIKKMEEIETLKNYIIDCSEHRKLFDRLSIPKLKIRNDEIVVDNYFQLNKNDKDSKYLQSYYINFKDKKNKTQEEEKFIRMIGDYIN